MRNGWIRYFGGMSLSLTIVGTSMAQGTSQNAPMLNAFGRFWGIGYSQGYHACDDGRCGWGLARDFRTSPTPNPALTAIYTAPYQTIYVNPQFSHVAWPTGTAAGATQVFAAPTGSTQPPRTPVAGESVSRKPVLPNLPTVDSQNSPSDRPQAPARPAAPPRPTVPPPEWLKRYLPADEVGGAVLLDSVESLQPAPAVNAKEPIKPQGANSTDDDLLIPEAESDDSLSPKTSSRAPRQAPIYYVPQTSNSNSRTAGAPGNAWPSPAAR